MRQTVLAQNKLPPQQLQVLDADNNAFAEPSGSSVEEAAVISTETQDMLPLPPNTSEIETDSSPQDDAVVSIHMFILF